MIPARAYKLLLFGDGSVLSRFEPKVSISIQISCIISLDLALFKCCMKSFPFSETQGKPLTSVSKEFTQFITAGLLLTV